MRSLVAVFFAVCLVGAHASLKDPNYETALALSWVFYEVQQSGPLPCWNRVAWWQPGGWRVPSHLTDGKAEGLDLSGGWYDAGDHVKATQALGWTVSTLAWGALEFPEAYELTKQKDVMLRNLKWAADWLVKAHYQQSDDPKKNGIIGQVGDPNLDHAKWWKPNDEPEGFCRVAIKVTCDKPGADVAGQAAAGLAAVSILYKDIDSAYSNTLLKHAKQLYAFGKECPGIWSLIKDATIYPSNSYKDDLAWAAAWLCKADSSFCNEAKEQWRRGEQESKGKYNSDWDNVFAQTTVLLMSSPINTDRAAVQPYIKYMETLLFYWQDSLKNCTGSEADYQTCMSSNGLLFTTSWGNIPKAANVALLSLAYAKHLVSRATRIRRRCWARQQVALMLGESGRSFMVGFGPNQPKSPHHRSASCPTDPCKQCGTAPFEAIPTGPNPNTLWGALLGGQDAKAEFKDEVANYRQAEGAVDWNAGVAGALAGLIWFKNAFPATTWDKYCSQNIMVADETLFDDTAPSTAVTTVAVPVNNVTSPTPMNSAAGDKSAEFWRAFLDPQAGQDKCAGNLAAAGPAPTCNPPTIVPASFAAPCASNYYGPQRKSIEAAAGAVKLTGLLAALAFLLAMLVL